MRDNVWTAGSRGIEILRVLRRHGVLRTGARPEPTDVRAALEELGPVFQKFGQVLALRRDLLPEAHVRELESLHDRVPALPLEQVLEAVRHAVGASADEVFASFDPEPLAAATIAQVHAARLADGRPVVVKVRRPGISDTLERDTRVLSRVARLADRLVPRLRPLDLPALVAELRESLRRETDFRGEAQSIRRFRESLSDYPAVWIPDVIDELSTDAVLTMEHSPGERIDHYVRDHPDAASELASAVAALVLRQIFEDGLFHADPHPGNLFVLPDGRLCLHDFGMIGELSEPLREGLSDLLAAEVRGDARAAVDAYLRLGLPGEDVDRDELERAFDHILADMHGRPLEELSLGEEIQKLIRLGGRHRIRNPRELLLLGRAFLIAEALLRRLDPGINVIEVFQGHLRRIELRRLEPDRLLRAGIDAVRSAGQVAGHLPADIQGTIRRLAAGDLGRVRDDTVAREVRQLRNKVGILSGAVAGGALLVAAAILLPAGTIATGLGFAAAVAGAAVLIWSYVGGRSSS